MTGPEALLARGVLWRWVARAFAYPDDGTLARLSGDDPWRQLDDARAAAELDRRLANRLAACRQAASELADANLTLAEEHTFLFGRHVRVSPYEASYAERPGADRSALLAEVGGFYAAFGFRVSPSQPEMLDHVSAECEFLAALLAKEAYAIALDWRARARLTRRARRRFVADHLGRWLPRMAERLAAHRRLAFYPAVAALALELLASERRPATDDPGSTARGRQEGHDAPALVPAAWDSDRFDGCGVPLPAPALAAGSGPPGPGDAPAAVSPD